MKSLKNILCPVDFSEPSYRAIEQASFLAQMLQADLTLLHVVQQQIPAHLGVVKGADASSQAMLETATEQARALPREAERNYVPFSISLKTPVPYGAPIPAILAEAAERQSALICIPCDLQGVDEGNKGVELLQHAESPVLFCRNLDEQKGFRKLLLALSDDDVVKDMAGYLHDHFDLMIQHLHLLVPGGDQAAERMTQWAAQLRDAGLHDFTSEFISTDLLAQEWVHAGKEKNSHLMVVPWEKSSQKHSNQRMTMLLKESEIPLLFWKPQ